MAISQKSKFRITDKLKKIFPDVNPELIGEKTDGSIQTLHVTVPSIPDDKVMLLAELVSIIPCRTIIKGFNNGSTIISFY